MNFTKAIELNKESEKSLRDNKFTDHADAIKLGNEAMGAMKSLRANALLGPDEPLPGETEE